MMFAFLKYPQLESSNLYKCQLFSYLAEIKHIDNVLSHGKQHLDGPVISVFNSVCNWICFVLEYGSALRQH